MCLERHAKFYTSPINGVDLETFLNLAPGRVSDAVDENRADPPGWPLDPNDNPRPGRIGSARFGFLESQGSVNGSSSISGFMESSSSGAPLI